MLGPTLIRRKVVSISDYAEKKPTLLCGECLFFNGEELRLSKLERLILELYDHDPDWLSRKLGWAQSAAEVEDALKGPGAIHGLRVM